MCLPGTTEFKICHIFSEVKADSTYFPLAGDKMSRQYLRSVPVENGVLNETTRHAAQTLKDHGELDIGWSIYFVYGFSPVV